LLYTQIAFAAQITITFSNPIPAGPTGTCGQSWTENGVPLTIVNAPGYGGSTCNVTYAGGNLILQEGSALSVDLAGLGLVNAITTNFISNCGISCLGMVMLSNGTTQFSVNNTTSNQAESKTVYNSAGNLIDEFRVNLSDDNTTLFDIVVDYEPIGFSNRKIDFTNPIPDAPVGDTDNWIEAGIPLSISPVNGSSNPVYGNGQFVMNELTQLDIDLSGIQDVSSIVTQFQNNSGCLSFKYYSAGNLVDQAYYSSPGNNLTEVFTNTNLDDIDLMRVYICDDTAPLFCIDINYLEYYPGCDSETYIEAQGDVYVPESCHGVILTSPNGLCFRLRVEDDGTIRSELVDCP